MPRVADSLSNRFIPTYRIRTKAVLTIDDDILISERDISRMEITLRTNNYSHVIGPFPRWYKERPGKSPRLKYLFNPEAGLPQGYPIMLTKVHVSHFELYYHYFCDDAYVVLLCALLLLCVMVVICFFCTLDCFNHPLHLNRSITQLFFFWQHCRIC